mmetsp:Transcript_30248/g.49304  ORF Transcript_30248/g.49304 Transcript_30248/m.49304 type:complete len:192 (+) Transcript_30248:502-1077(+)
MSSFGRPTAEDFLFNHCVRRAGHASGTQSGKTRDQTVHCSSTTMTILSSKSLMFYSKKMHRQSFFLQTTSQELCDECGVQQCFHNVFDVEEMPGLFQLKTCSTSAQQILEKIDVCEEGREGEDANTKTAKQQQRVLRYSPHPSLHMVSRLALFLCYRVPRASRNSILCCVCVVEMEWLCKVVVLTEKSHFS